MDNEQKTEIDSVYKDLAEYIRLRNAAESFLSTRMRLQALLSMIKATEHDELVDESGKPLRYVLNVKQ